MALDFPASPTNGQTYTAPNGVIWAWDGTKWVNGTQVGTAYAPVNSPVFTGDPQAPNPPAGDADTSVATTSFVQAAVAPYAHNVGRNLLHNSLFNVQQRGAGPFTAIGYTLDRWYQGFVNGTISTSRVALTDADRTAIGDEAATYALQSVVVGGAPAASFTQVQMPLEGVRPTAGKTLTVSFWAKAASGTPKIGINFTQAFGSGGSPSASVATTGSAVTVSTTWTRYTVTQAVPSIIGKVLGTDGTDQLDIGWWLSSGTTNNTQAGNIGVQSGTFQLWGMQLEIGSVATPLEKPDPRYDLSNCMRFYQTGNFYLAANSTAGNNFGGQVYFPAWLRGAPTIVFTGAPALGNCTGMTAVQPAGGGFIAIASTTATGYCSMNAAFTASADL
jgi:hypothetical protein